MAGNDERLSDSLLKSAVAKKHGVAEDVVSIEDWSTSGGSADGDNFSCDLVAVQGSAQVNGKTEPFSFMCKLEPVVEMRKQMLKQMEIFDKEAFLYGDLLPKLNESRAKVGLEAIPAPKSFWAQSNPDILVLENLKDFGFSLIKSKESGMDEGELMSMLEALAALHASTAHHLEGYPGGIQGFREKHPDMKFLKNMGKDIQDLFRSSTESILDNFITIAKEHFSPEIAQRLKAFKDADSFDKFIDFFTKPFGDYQLVIHGDAWYNNAMFAYDEGLKVKEAKLLDFQVSRITSPALDLVYCITTGTNYTSRKPNLEKWLSHYYQKFARDLNALGLEAESIYSLDHLKKDYNQVYSFAFTFSLGHSQILLKKDENFDIADIKNAGSFEEMTELNAKTALSSTNQIKTNEPYRERVFGLIQEAIDRELI